MNGIIPVQSNLYENKNIFSDPECDEVPGEKCVVKHVVVVLPQICWVNGHVGYVDCLEVGQIHIRPVPHNKF